MLGVAVELARSYDSEHVQGTSCQSHLLADPQVLVDLHEETSRQDLDGHGATVLHAMDGL